jgi:hypothetical protein
VVLFRGKVAGLKRDVLESGDFEAKKDHIAEIIAQFLDPESVDLLGGIGSYGGDAEDNLTETGEDFLQDTEAEEEEAPISQEEMEHFVSFDLQRIDEAAYFHRHFGD